MNASTKPISRAKNYESASIDDDSTNNSSNTRTYPADNGYLFNPSSISAADGPLYTKNSKIPPPTTATTSGLTLTPSHATNKPCPTSLSPKPRGKAKVNQHTHEMDQFSDEEEIDIIKAPDHQY